MFGMKKESIEVLIDADGNTAIEGQNFKGGMCEKVTSFLEKALGSLIKRKHKTERWQKDQNVCQLH